MDRNSVIGLALIALILIGYSYFTSPSAEEIKAEQARQDSLKQAEQVLVDTGAVEVQQVNASDTASETSAGVLPAGADSLETILQQRERERAFGHWAPYIAGQAEEIKVETDRFTVFLSTRGAQITRVILKDFVRYSGEPLDMFDPESHRFTFRLPGGNTPVESEDLYFQYTGAGNLKLTGEEEQSLSFTAGGMQINYRFSGSSYRIGCDINNSPANDDLILTWSKSGWNNEKHLPTERQKCSVYYRYFEDKRDYLSESSEDEEKLETRTNWVAFKQNFFSTILISESGIQPENSVIRIRPFEEEEDTLRTKQYFAQLNLGEGNNHHFDLFYGPNDYGVLKDLEVEYADKIIDFGWAIFGWVNKYLIRNIFLLLDQTGMGYGLIILILTLIIKMLLSPLTYKNFVSSAKMRVLKPEIEKINQRMKDADAMKKQQEIMALYKQTGVNPMAGCLPMLLQMPILYAMFRFFPSAIELRQESFLWADDLSSYDSILSLPFEIPFYGDHVSLFTLLMCLSTVFYTRLNSTQMPQQQEGMPNMKVMMYLFPVMMLFFFNNFSSGLSYYYLMANVISIAQMYVIREFIIDEDKILAEIEANKKKKGKGKQSRLQRKMEEMAKKRGYNLPKG